MVLTQVKKRNDDDTDEDYGSHTRDVQVGRMKLIDPLQDRRGWGQTEERCY